MQRNLGTWVYTKHFETYEILVWKGNYSNFEHPHLGERQIIFAPAYCPGKDKPAARLHKTAELWGENVSL